MPSLCLGKVAAGSNFSNSIVFVSQLLVAAAAGEVVVRIFLVVKLSHRHGHTHTE